MKKIVERKHLANNRKRYDVDMYLEDRFRAWEKLLKEKFRKFQALKYDIQLTSKLEKRIVWNNTFIHHTTCFRSTGRSIFTQSNISSSLRSSTEQVLESYDLFMKMGSGWVLHSIISSQINIYQNEIRGGGCYKIIRKKLLPSRYVKNTRCLLTFKPNQNNQCFLYCILAALFPVKKHRNKAQSYNKKLHLLDSSMLSFPVSIQQIPKFEEANQIKINVIGIPKNEEGFFFLYKSQLSKNLNEQGKIKQINLLLFREHYSLITSWSCFLNYNNTNKRQMCQNCGNFIRKHAHLSDCTGCRNSRQTNLVFPEKGSVQKFQNYQKIAKSPFVYYADIECSLQDDFEHSEDSNKIKKKKIHIPVAIGLMRVCVAEEFSHKEPIIHIGKDCMKSFFETLKNEVTFKNKILTTVNYPIDMSKQDEENFQNAEKCYVCDKIFKNLSEKRRDHSHLLAHKNFLGAACESCNLNRTDLKGKKTALIFHGASKYDNNCLIKSFHHLNILPSNIIAKTGESIMSMSFFNNEFMIIDSFNHLPFSLEKAVGMLNKSNKPLKHTLKALNNDSKALKLLSQKLPFPYSFITPERLRTQKELPDEKFFYNDLNETEISADNYALAKEIWRYFNCQTLSDYLEIYLKSDILYLVDVFQHFRAFFNAEFQLESAKYLSISSLSYDCMLKYTKCQIELIHDQEMYNFIRDSIRGGLTNIPQRYFKANNKYMQDYDKNKPSSFIAYLDANALYSSVMTLKLPVAELRWVKFTPTKVNEILENYSDESKYGYIFETTLDYPEEIHQKTKDFPLAPEHRIVTKDMLSPLTKAIIKKLQTKVDKNVKLLTTQYPKQFYKCHVSNLIFYLKMGMKLKKVHRVLQFKQAAVFEPYITFCMQQRQQTNISSHERDLWKLVSNSVYGKTLTNLEKRQNINFVTDDKQLSRAINSPRFRHADVISSNLVQVSKSKRKILMNIPYQIGAAILDLSKLVMYRFYYNTLIKKYGIFGCSMLFQDTDSICIGLQTENYFQDLKNLGIIDFSNFPEDHPFHDKKNSGKLFHFKDESAGHIPKSFVGLKPKCYSLEYQDTSLNKLTSKGVPRNQKNKIKHKDLLEVLFKHTTKTSKSLMIRSFKHQLYTVQQTKLSLSPLDNKRFLLQDGITTLPFGNCKISSSQEEEQ